MLGKKLLKIYASLSRLIKHMKNLEYFSPEEINKHKELIQKTLNEQGSSPVVKTNIALAITRKYLPDKNSALLDCGPGAGSYLKSIHEDGYLNVFAVDIDKYSAFDFVKEFKIADLSFAEIPWLDGFFDIVTAWQMIEHLENPHNFLREVHRILKPAGIFIVSMPNIQHLFNKMFFIRTGDMFRWKKNNNHIALFPKGLFEKTFLKYFDVIEKRFTAGEFPWRFLDKIKWPSNELFGRDVIFVLRKKQ